MSPIAPPLASEARPSVPTPAAALRSEERQARPADADAGASKPPTANAPNPKLRVDPELGLVVLEFRSAQGETTSHPTSRELDAYRRAARSGKPASDRITSAEPSPARPTPGRSESGPSTAFPAAFPQPVPVRPAPGQTGIGQPAIAPAYDAVGGPTASVPQTRAAPAAA